MEPRKIIDRVGANKVKRVLSNAQIDLAAS